MRLIGLGHRARQGKNIVAEAIASCLPGTKIYAFADELKRYCAQHHEELFRKYPNVAGTQKADPIYGYVAMLQYFGTEVMRKQDPTVWVRKLKERLDIENPSWALISDVRFPDEAQFIKDAGGVLIKVQRYDADGALYVAPDRDPNHPSETALDDYEGWDVIISAQSGKTDILKEAAQNVAKIIAQNSNGPLERFLGKIGLGAFRSVYPSE